jgi:uncharacterized protein YdaU (DUF1376 family)
MRSHSVRTENEEEAFNNVLSDFFTLTDGGYRHGVCDTNIDKYQEKSEKARKSANARWEKNANASKTQCDGNANHKPITNNQEPRTNSKNITLGFDDFWTVFPKKADKKKAREIWKRRKLDKTADLIISDVVKRIKLDKKWIGGFITNPTTYLNGDRWEDEIELDEKKISLAKRMENYDEKSSFAKPDDNDESVISDQ